LNVDAITYDEASGVAPKDFINPFLLSMLLKKRCNDGVKKHWLGKTLLCLRECAKHDCCEYLQKDPQDQ
jgi:hypothetical protein